MAGIDALIAQGTSTGPGGFDPLEIARLSQQIQAARQNQAIQAQQQQAALAKQQADMERQSQLQGILAGGGNLEENLLKGGFGDESMKFGKYGQEKQKSALDLQKEELGIIGNAAGHLYSDPSWANAQRIAADLRSRGINADKFEAEAFEFKDRPNDMQKLAARYGMSVKEQLPKLEQQNVGNAIIDRTVNPVTNEITPIGSTPVQMSPYQQEQVGLERSQQALTRRGQDLTDSRSREANQLKAAETVGGPKLTEIQAKAQLFGNRAQEANRIISGLEGKYSPLAVNAKLSAENTPLIGGGIGAAANMFIGENEQLAEQAQRDFINAILRQESGAVISSEEFNNARKQYFPQPGDTKNVLKQKQNNRERAIKGFDVMAGPAGGFAKPAEREAAPQGTRFRDKPSASEVGTGARLFNEDTGRWEVSNGKSWVAE